MNNDASYIGDRLCYAAQVKDE